MKIALQRSKAFARYTPPPGCGHTAISFALPYYRSPYGQYIHRVRSGFIHRRDGLISHLSFSFWCGTTGFIEGDPKIRIGTKRYGDLFASIPEGGILCATCEGRAIGAGMDGSPEINGRAVIFSPRKPI